MEQLGKINGRKIWYATANDNGLTEFKKPIVAMLHSDDKDINVITVLTVVHKLITHNCRYICSSGSAAYKLERYADDVIVEIVPPEEWHKDPPYKFWSPTIVKPDFDTCLFYSIFSASRDDAKNIVMNDVVVVDFDGTKQLDAEKFVNHLSDRHFVSMFRKNLYHKTISHNVQSM